MTACPPLEDIAAFLDGKLSPEEHARITEHLARCESCYEIFAGAVHFQEEEGVVHFREEEEEEVSAAAAQVHRFGGWTRERHADDTGGRGVLPFPLAQEKNQETKTQETTARVEPGRPARHASRWQALAASVLLVGTLGFLAWQHSRTLPELSAAGLVEPLQKKPQLVAEKYQPKNIPRSGEDAAALILPPPAFLTGIYLIDLRLSVEARNVEVTQELLYDVLRELAQVYLMQGEVDAWKTAADQMTDPAALDHFARSFPQRESALQNQLAEEPFFRFGLWTEGGRLSAVAKSPTFFESRVNRRFLSVIPREVSSLNDDRYAPIQESLRQIEDLWDRQPRDYKALAHHFENIIDQIDEIKKQDQDDLESVGEPLP